jgi:hypothetical protein
MSIRIWISKGSTSYELTNYDGARLVMKNTLKIRESEYGSKYAPTLNSASFEMLFAGVPAALMLEDDVEISILEDGSPLFTGYVRPLSSLDFRRTGVNDRITIDAEGCMSRLTTAEHSGETVDLGSSLKVFQPDNPVASFVHVLLSRMGWARGISGPAIDREMPIALLMDGDKLLDKIARALFCAGYYLTELPDGSLVVRPFVVTDPVATKTFSVADRNIIGELNVTRSEPDNKALALTYGYHKTSPKYSVYAEDIKHVIYSHYAYSPLTFDKKPWVWPYNLAADGTPIHIYKGDKFSDLTWSNRYSTVRKKLDAEGNETSEEDLLIALPSPDVTGLVTGLWKYTNLRAQIYFTDICDPNIFGIGWEGSYRKSGTIRVDIPYSGGIYYYRIADGSARSLESDHPLYGCVKTADWTAAGLNLKIGPIPYMTNDRHWIYIEGCSIYGKLDYIFSNSNATYDEDAPRIVVGEGSREKISAEYCFQPSDAEGIARALHVGLGSPIAKFSSDDNVASGAIVQVLREGRGIDILGRIIAKDNQPDAKVKRYTYSIEGLSALTIESDYLPSIQARLESSNSSSQSIAELIAARARQAATEANTEETIEEINANIEAVETKIEGVRAGDLVDGAIARAKLEAGFIDEHERSVSELWPSGLGLPSAIDMETEARLAEVAAERDRLDRLEPEIFPQGPTAPSAPDIIAGDLLSVAALADILEREIASRDQGMIIAEQRILLIAQDTAGAVERVASLELTIDEIEAIVAEFEGDHTRIAALEIQTDGIEASVSDYDAEKAKIATLELTVDSINSILAELNVGGEIINLSLIVQNANRIAQIVADGGYTDDQGIFHPTRAYTQVTQLTDRYELFLAGDASEMNLATWIATAEQIASFVTAAQVTGEIEGALAPVAAAVSAIEQRADAIELSVADVAGSIDQAALETREALLAALDQLEAQASAGIVLARNRIDLVVAAQSGENVSLWARIALEADRITSEVGRATGSEVELSSRIIQEAGRISQEIEDRIQGVLDARSYVDQTATSILSSVESDMQALDGTLRNIAASEAEEAVATASAYADGIVTAEEERAIADAQAKANTARAAAIEAAATDASAKATAARAAAEAYALAKATEAATTASAYADGIVTEEEQRAIADAQAKADAAEQAATTVAASYTDSQILQLWNAIIARVEQTEIALDPQEDGSVAYKAAAAWAQLLLEPGTFATRIQASEDGIIQNGSLIEQLKDLIVFRVDEALLESMAGIVISANRIDLAVSEQRSSAETLLARIVVEANRITAEVERATEAEGQLGTDIYAAIQIQADRIAAEVAERLAGDSALDAQLVIQAASIAQRVQAKTWNDTTQEWELAADAFMALQISLPTTMTVTRRAAIQALLTVAEIELFDRVYESYEYNYGDSPTETYYRVSGDADEGDIAMLKEIFRTHGLLSSQFLVDADDVLLNGTIKGKKLEMESVATDVFKAIKARIQELSAKKLKVDTDVESSDDFEVYIDEDNGILVKNAGITIFSINPTTGKIYIYGTADIEDGTFRGSVESGPLILNKGAPASSNFTIQGIIANFILNVVSATRLNGAIAACSGTYQGVDIEAVYLQAVSSPKTYTYRQWGPAYYKAWCYYYDWTATTTAYDLTIKFYKKSDHSELFSHTEHYEPSAQWVQGTQHTAEYDAYKYTWDPEPSPNPKAQIGGTQTFGATGTLSFTALAFTCKLVNLPTGYSSDYAAGTIYVDQNGFLKIKT